MQIFKKFQVSLNEFKKVKTLTFGALLTALYVLSAVFLNFYPSDSIKISISFIFIATAAYLYGPTMAMLVGGMGDFLAWLIHPHGALIIGITAANALIGLIFGLFYYKERFTLPRCIIACTVEALLIEVVMKTAVLSHAFGTPIKAEFWIRLPGVAVMLAVMIALTYTFFKCIKPIQKMTK